MVSFTGQTIEGYARELEGTGLFAGLVPAQILRGIPLLAHLPEKELARLAGEATVCSYEPGAAICRQGEFDDNLYLILAGKVEVSLMTEGGQRVGLEQLGRGGLFGRLTSAGEGQNMASVVAAERTHLISLSPEAVRRLAEKDAAISEALRQGYLARTVRAALHLVPIFAEAGAQAIDLLAQAGSLISFPKGKVIFNQGEPGDSLYLVVSGVVKIYAADRVFAYLKSGGHFGERALLMNEPRTASAAAVTNVEAFRIMKGAFDAFLGSYESAADALRSIVRRREQENKALAEHPERAERLRFMERLMGGRDILVIDLRRCVRCDKCVKACAQARGQARFERKGQFSGGYLIATACQHCQDPACMLCKRGAIARDKTGEIYIKENCVGCGFCAKQCPYGNIMIVEVEGPAASADGKEAHARGRKKAAKCDLCRHLEYPPCVFNCPTGALRRVEPEELMAKRGGKGK